MALKRAAALATLAVAALLLLGGAASATAKAAPRYDSPNAPLVLHAGQTLAQQFGYAPDYVRNVPDFYPTTTNPANQLVPAGTPFIRSRTADIDRTSFVETLTGGVWVRYSLIPAIRAAYPTFTGTVNGAGWDNQHLVFDTAGRAYTVLTIRLADGSQHNLLLYSLDACHTWALASSELPPGEVTSEFWTGHNHVDGPPFVLTWRLYRYHPSRNANHEYLFVTQPYWSGSTLVVPPSIQVTHECFGVSAHSGGGSLAVTHNGKTYFVWGQIDDTKSDPGSPIYVGVYDQATGTVTDRARVGWVTPRNDEHCTPAITVDSTGILHIVLGSHDGQLRYCHSKAPDSIASGFTNPAAIAGANNATYTGLVCDQSDNLYIAYRQTRADGQHFGGKQYGVLAAQRLDAGASTWNSPVTLIVPAGIGYVVYYHKLTVDLSGRLWITASNLSGTELNSWRVGWRIWKKLGRHGPRPSRYLHNLVMTTAGGGWHLATTSDFVPPPSPPRSDGADAAAPADRAAVRLLTTGTGTWQWLAPTPQGNDIGGVWFVNKSTGWAVGDAGTLLKTTTGGRTWLTQASHTGADLLDVRFANAKTGWILGAGGTVLHTTNAGHTWKRQHSHTGNTLFACSFLSATTGLAVGDNGTIVKTTNGGKSWGVKSSGTNSGLFSVSFVDTKHAWAVGEEGLIIASVDGGKSWKAQYPPGVGSSGRAARRGSSKVVPRRTYPDLYGMCFVSAKTGFAVGDGSTLLTTRNGGKSWKLTDLGAATTLYAVRFASKNVGWAVGTGGELLSTTDGGRAWKHRGVPTAQSLLCVATTGSGRVWAGGVGGTLLASTNGGGHWTALGGGGTTSFDALAFPSSTQGWVGGSGGTLLSTVDAGQHWAARSSGTGATLRALDFTDPADGWAAGDGGALRCTINGGATWTAGATGTVQDLLGLDFWDANNGWAVGAAGTVLHSTDGGATWSPQDSGASVDLYGVTFVSATEGWAVGGDAWGEDHAVVLHTTTGGEDPDGPGPLKGWTLQTTGGWGRLRAVAFSSPLVGWAVGDDWGADADSPPTGVICRTTNGGASWAVSYTGVPGTVNAVVPLSASTVYAAGDDGLLLKSTNGGAGWTRLRSGSGNDLHALRFVSPSVGYAAGENETVLLTTKGG